MVVLHAYAGLGIDHILNLDTRRIHTQFLSLLMQRKRIRCLYPIAIMTSLHAAISQVARALITRSHIVRSQRSRIVEAAGLLLRRRSHIYTALLWFLQHVHLLVQQRVKLLILLDTILTQRMHVLLHCFHISLQCAKTSRKINHGILISDHLFCHVRLGLCCLGGLVFGCFDEAGHGFLGGLVVGGLF